MNIQRAGLGARQEYSDAFQVPSASEMNERPNPGRRQRYCAPPLVHVGQRYGRVDRWVCRCRVAGQFLLYVVEKNCAQQFVRQPVDRNTQCFQISLLLLQIFHLFCYRQLHILKLRYQCSILSRLGSQHLELCLGDKDIFLDDREISSGHSSWKLGEYEQPISLREIESNLDGCGSMERGQAAVLARRHCQCRHDVTVTWVLPSRDLSQCLHANAEPRSLEVRPLAVGHGAD